MKRNIALFFLLVLAGIAANGLAQDRPDTDMPADSVSVEQTTATNTVANDTTGIQPTINQKSDSLQTTKTKKRRKKATPTAVDNTVRLLATADSMATILPNPSMNRMMYLPIIFSGFKDIPDRHIEVKAWDVTRPDSCKKKELSELLKPDFAWLDEIKWNTWFENYHVNHLTVHSPWLVPYNSNDMPEPPKPVQITSHVQKNPITIHQRKYQLPKDAPGSDIKQRNWFHKFNASLQFSQSYLSENWYQGGTKNLNMIGNVYYDLQLNQALHPNHLFQFTAQYKLGINSAPDDELRNYAINEDLFQINAKYGLKATNKFYYSMNMQFKTQMLRNYETNTTNLTASFLTPGELNTGIGMAYNTTNKQGTLTFDASLSPLSYNMKICLEYDRIDPSTFGIENGRHIGHEIGSSGECKISWNIIPGISLSSRLFLFSDYSYLQGDLETTLNFSVTKYLSTQIYANLRYDDSAAYNHTWKYWQFKEIFSFGLQYQFNI